MSFPTSPVPRRTHPWAAAAAIALALAVTFSLMACGPREPNARPSPGSASEPGQEIGQGPADPAPTADSELPPSIREWIERSRTILAGQVKEEGGRLYVLVTYGERPTGGYEVAIEEIREEAERLLVRVRFTEPAPDAMSTQALTHPYDLAVTDPTPKPVEFEATGALSHVPRLVGIEELPPIVAASTWIKLFAPAPGERIGEALTLRGIANVFEGNVEYRLSTASGQTLADGFTTAMMGDWGYFEEEIAVPEEAGPDPVLTVFTTSAKDGSVEEEIRVPLAR